MKKTLAGITTLLILVALPVPPAHADDPVFDPDGHFVFDRAVAVEAYFQAIATNVAFVDPARGVDCRAGAAPCTYNPLASREGPADVHYSDV